ncbi:MAG: hypothetical protein AABY22_09575 [Nanoarchaeota archaeon]
METNAYQIRSMIICPFGIRHYIPTIKEAMKCTCPHIMQWEPTQMSKKQKRHLSYDNWFQCEICIVSLLPYTACCVKDIHNI